MARATVSASPGLAMAAWEPPLKARKPKNRMNPPRAAVLRVQREKMFLNSQLTQNVSKHIILILVKFNK